MNEIQFSSEKFLLKINESKWIEADASLKKLMIIFMQNLTNPVIKLNLFNIADVNLRTFLRVGLKTL